MEASPLSAAAMIVGLLFILAGYLSPQLTPTSSVWTNEQAEQYSKAASTLHSASYGSSHDHSADHSHDSDPHSRPEYLSAKAEFDRNLEALENVRRRQTWLKYGLIFTGVAIAGAGIIKVCLAKMDEDNPKRTRPK